MNSIVDEQQLLQQLEELKQELIALQYLPERQQLKDLSQAFLSQWQDLQKRQKINKQTRDLSRSQSQEDDSILHIQLNQESQQESLDRRSFKYYRDQTLEPLTTKLLNADRRIQEIKQERQILSEQLRNYLQNCPLRPLTSPLAILYEDDHLIAIDKPAGLLSVPGRGSDRQESVLSYLKQTYDSIEAIHRLDQDTSGILLFAKDLLTHQTLQQQFAQHLVKKVYEAILENSCDRFSGTIELPLWGDPSNRPYQSVNLNHGKSAITKFNLLNPSESRVELIPLTGRTHQLRVHCADSNGLNNPILGDRLYGTQSQIFQSQILQSQTRLHLHATRCSIWYDGKWLNLVSNVPF